MFNTGSAYAIAPARENKPAINHTINNRNADCVYLAISAETINIPQPIIEPTTTEIESFKFNVLCNSLLIF